jgi:D-alanyl-D-alanine carboxypeptidase
MQSVGEAVAKAGAPPAKSVPWDPSWSRFAGKYKSKIGGEVEVIELNKRLVSIDPSGAFPDNPNQLVPIGNGLFRLEAKSGGGPVGETVRFVEQNGKVTRMYTGGSYSERQ